MIKIVMYHYVRPKDQSNLHYLDLLNFRRQLDFFQSNGGIISRKDWNVFKSGGSVNGYLLTFDDGLADHYNFVLPELLKRGLFGIFFVCTNPLEFRKPLTVHLLHAALAQSNPVSLLKRIIEITNIHPEEFDEAMITSTYTTQKSVDVEKSVKRIVNYGKYSLEIRSEIDKFLLGLLPFSQEEFCQYWYIDKPQCVDLESSGMEVGSHSVTHRLLKNLSMEEVIYEIQHSKSFLLSEGLSVTEFCYPFGGRKSFSQDQKLLLSSLYDFGHSVEAKDLNMKSFDNLELPRFDCNYWDTQKSWKS